MVYICGNHYAFSHLLDDIWDSQLQGWGWGWRVWRMWIFVLVGGSGVWDVVGGREMRGGG